MNKLLNLIGVCICFLMIAGGAEAKFTALWTTSISLDPGMKSMRDGNRIGDRFGVHAKRQSRIKNDLSLPGLNFSGWHESPILGMESQKDKIMSKMDESDYRYTVGIPFLSPNLFSWTKPDGKGYRGIAWTIGYYSKTYFNTQRRDAWNTFWHWGTAYLVLPWIGVGTEYTTSNFYFEVGTFYILPYLGAGFHF